MEYSTAPWLTFGDPVEICVYLGMQGLGSFQELWNTDIDLLLDMLDAVDRIHEQQHAIDS